jgi:hypothetical protein
MLTSEIEKQNQSKKKNNISSSQPSKFITQVMRSK